MSEESYISHESYSYVVESGGEIPSFVSEAESLYNYGRPINSRLGQQQVQQQLSQKKNDINHKFQQSQQQQQLQNPPPTSLTREPNKKEGKLNINIQTKPIQEQPYKREIKQEESNEHNRQYQRFEENISQDQFPLQISKQYQERKIETNKIIQQELKYKKTGQQRRESKHQDKQRKPAQSNQNNMKLNIQKKIRKLQEFTRHLLRKAPFMRLVRRTAQIICDQHHYDTPRFTYDAIVSLQEIMETTMVRLIEDAYMITTNSNRATLYGKDLTVLRRIRNAPWDTI